jgi:hypothetical protein
MTLREKAEAAIKTCNHPDAFIVGDVGENAEIYHTTGAFACGIGAVGSIAGTANKLDVFMRGWKACELRMLREIKHVG